MGFLSGFSNVRFVENYGLRGVFLHKLKIVKLPLGLGIETLHFKGHW